MANYMSVDPSVFIDPLGHKPESGRGAWNKKGLDWTWRYEYQPDKTQLGTLAQKSLDYWAVSRGIAAYQDRLVTLGFMSAVPNSERGIFGPKTRSAVMAFQRENRDPEGDVKLDVDGTIGTGDSKALIVPVILAVEKKYEIPGRYLLGETLLESQVLDLGALGSQIFYGVGESLQYRGVDRGVSMINSLYNPQVSWRQAFDPPFAIDWSGARIRHFHDEFKSAYPSRSETVLWDAALCAHNNPTAAWAWAKAGQATTKAAAEYVAKAKEAIFP